MCDTNLYDVEAFLSNLVSKISIFNIIFENRDKNNQTLLDLEIHPPSKRIEFIKNLKAIDYSSGPNEDEFGGTPIWIFGIDIKGQEIYIKIQLNNFNKPVICISFHIAEHPLLYPFK